MSGLTAAIPTEAPLGAEEIAEMREHLAFIRRYKETLRLKLNAGEDLLVNGQREPTDRGVCRHLLGKVDRATIEGALVREPLRSDAAARARLLAGAVRLTADVGVLLAYLESLGHVRSRAEAAAAFAEVVRRLDFGSVSPTRLARLLQVLISTFVDHERVQVLFGLLANEAFRNAFDAAAGALPDDVVVACAPLRALHRQLLAASAGAAPEVVAGLEVVLAAPDPVLQAYPERFRAGMLEIALTPGVPGAVADRAASVLLSSLPHAGRAYAQLAHRRAAQLLARHADDGARAVLDELGRARPELRTAARWLGALTSRRLGRIAIVGEPPAEGRLTRAFWLDEQRDVWLRTAAGAEAERLAREAALHTDCPLPGIAALVEHGAASGMAYVAVAGPGEPLVTAERLESRAALVFLAAATRILHALALAGILLRDVEPTRFLHGQGVLLADLDGASRTSPSDAGGAHTQLAAGLARRMLGSRLELDLPPDTARELAETLASPPDLPGLVRALERAALHVVRR